MNAEDKDTQGQQEQQPGNTHPEDTRAPSGKMFTQEEVNKIVAERITRERSKAQPSEADQKAAELEAKEREIEEREFMFESRRKFESWGFDGGLADLIKVDELRGDIRGVLRTISSAFRDGQRGDDAFFDAMREQEALQGASPAKNGAADSALRSIFGLKKKGK